MTLDFFHQFWIVYNAKNVLRESGEMKEVIDEAYEVINFVEEIEPDTVKQLAICDCATLDRCKAAKRKGLIGREEELDYEE